MEKLDRNLQPDKKLAAVCGLFCPGCSLLIATLHGNKRTSFALIPMGGDDMTSRKRETVLSPLLRWFGRSAVVFLVLMITFGSPPLRAQPASSKAHTQKSENHAKKPRPAMPSKPVGARAKPRVRGAAKTVKPAAESAGQSSPEANDKVPTPPPVGTSATVDFDTEDDVQKMEPGLELIQAAPRPARHRSLVPASPSPEDSVVNRE
jgi:hypothetical protein